MFIFTTLVQHNTESSRYCNEMSKINKRHTGWTKRDKTVTSADGMIVFREEIYIIF